MPTRTTQVEIIVLKIIKDEILFLLLKRNAQKGGFWQPITGGAQGEEELLHAVNRELKEETGVTEYLQLINDVHYFEFNSGEYGILKEYVYGIQITPETNIQISLEHTEMRWCNLEDSLALLKYENNKNGFRKLYSLLTKEQQV